MESFRAGRRKILGKKVKKLRARGLIPAVLYGRERSSIPIELEKNQFLETFRRVGESSVATLHLDSEEFPVLISSIDRDAQTLEPIHVNFHLVEMNKKIAAAVPIEVVGEAPAVKSGEGMLLTILPEIEVECLPKDLPSELKIDVSGLESLNDAIAIKDLPLDFSKVSVPGHNMEDLVLKIESAEMKEVEEEVKEGLIEEIEITEEKSVEDMETSEQEAVETEEESLPE